MRVEKTWAVHEKTLHPQVMVKIGRRGRGVRLVKGDDMEEGDYDQQPHLIGEIEQFLKDYFYQETEVDENIPDERPGPAAQGIAKVDGVNGYRAILTIFDILSLSEGTNRKKKKWKLYKAVLEAWVRYGSLRNTVPWIARDLKKSAKRIYGILAELICIFENFDDLYIEVKYRLADEHLQAAWLAIMVGEEPEAIRGKYGWDKARVDEVYATIWPTVDDVLRELLKR
jgi:hypothetical protein